MKKIVKSVTIVLLTFTLSSCGVIFGGSKYIGHIKVKDHPDAEIYVNGHRDGVGSSMNLYPRKQPLVIELKQEGCKSKTVIYKKTFRTGNFILSAISWGLEGIAIDLISGACFKPDHTGDTDIERIDTKNYVYTVDYSECPVLSATSN